MTRGTVQVAGFETTVFARTDDVDLDRPAGLQRQLFLPGSGIA